MTPSPTARTAVFSIRILLALLLGFGFHLVTATTAEADDTSFCGTHLIDDDDIDVDEMTWAEYGDASGYYDDKIAALAGLQQHLGMSRTDFCAAANWLIETGAEQILFRGVRGILVGDNGFIRDELFEEALGEAIKAQGGLPDRIPPVGGGATVGLTVSDVHLGGTDGSASPNPTWGHQAGSSWFPNGASVDVDCVAPGPGYPVVWASGVTERWATYYRAADGTYIKAAAVAETSSDGQTFGLPGC